jgi:predicted ATPase with chaperone activity
MDRIDIHIEVPAVKDTELRAPSSSEGYSAISRLGLSAWAHDRILKVARTIRTWKPHRIFSRNTSAKPPSTERSTAATGPGDFALSTAPLTWVYSLCYE